jgi:hypothetical protein
MRTAASGVEQTMLLITLTAGLLGTVPGALPPLHSGDIVLQASQSGMSETIQRATASPYSHVGIVEVTSKGVFVIEAIEPVSRTPFERWRARGNGGHLTVMRPHLSSEDITAALVSAKHELGKPYDTRYTWGDDRFYCSELVVKAFERGAHLTLGRKVSLDKLRLTPEERAVAELLGVSLSQEVVPPGSLADDPRLERVFSDMPGAPWPRSG